MLMTVIISMFKSNKKGIFLIGGLGYGLLEILWRGRTHWSMLLTGGVCFIALYKLFEKAEETALDRYDTLVERAKTTNKEVTVL